jgi:hypothetical protein
MGASEKTYRLYSCARCAKQVRICGDCDRGNRYCAEGCAQIRRRESLRRASSRYQQSYRGACKHAARSRAWRQRHAQKVTHQGSLGPGVAAIVVPNSTTNSTEETDGDTQSVRVQPHSAAFEARARARSVHWPGHYLASEPRCCFCGGVLPPFARLTRLRERR